MLSALLIVISKSSNRCHTNLSRESFLQLPSDHLHTLNPNRLLLIHTHNGIKEHGATSGELTSTIPHSILRTVPANIAAELPWTQALLYTIRRQRMVLSNTRL